MAGLGSFAGGLAGGFAAGARLGMEIDEAEERKKDRALNRELGLEQVKAAREANEERQREREYKTERSRFLQENIMEPVQIRDAADNVQSTSYRPRQLSDSDLMRVHEGVGAIDYRYGKIDPEKAIQMSRLVKLARDENAFDAYQEFVATGDPTAAERVFNQKGGMKIAPGSVKVERRKDDLTGQEYNALVAQTPDGRPLQFDPVLAGRAQAGAKGVAASLEAKRKGDLETREVSAKERTAKAAEMSAEGTREKNEAIGRYYDGAKADLDRARATKTTATPQEKPEVRERARKRLEGEIDAASIARDPKTGEPLLGMDNKPYADPKKKAQIGGLAADVEQVLEDRLGRELNAREIHRIAAMLPSAPLGNTEGMKKWAGEIERQFGLTRPAQPGAPAAPSATTPAATAPAAPAPAPAQAAPARSAPAAPADQRSQFYRPDLEAKDAELRRLRTLAGSGNANVSHGYWRQYLDRVQMLERSVRDHPGLEPL